MTDIGTRPRDERLAWAVRSPVADPSVAAPAGVAMSGPDVLLATKLHVPGPPPGFVPRPRLARALGEGLARGRVLVCAPAGSGKTALLAGCARGGGRPVGWLGLDAATATRPGSGGTWWPRWTGPGRGWPGGCARRPRVRLRAGDGPDQRAGRRSRP